MTTTEQRAEWARLAATIPAGAKADWRGTNHYEIHTDDEVWWLDLWDAFVAPGRDLQGIRDLQGTEEGRRVGAVMDAACAFREAVPALLADAKRLELERDEARENFGHEVCAHGRDSEALNRATTALRKAELQRDRLAEALREMLDGGAGAHNSTAAREALKEAGL